MRKRQFTVSDFICPVCGNTIPLPRKKSSQRKDGHIKDIWCPYCGKVQKFAEIKDTQSIRTLDWENISD